MDEPPSLPRELDCAAGALAWAGGLLAPDGSFAGAEDAVGAYYLAPLAFASGGRLDLAGLLCRYVGKRFFREGDINERAGDPASQVANFRNAFFGLSAQRVGAWDLSIAVADRLEGCQHPQSGGFSNHNLEDETRALDVGSSAAALLSLLAAGRLGAAQKAGDFLCEMIDHQPSPGERVLLRRTWDGDWITEYSPHERVPAPDRTGRRRAGLLVSGNFNGRAGPAAYGHGGGAVPEIGAPGI